MIHNHILLSETSESEMSLSVCSFSVKCQHLMSDLARSLRSVRQLHLLKWICRLSKGKTFIHCLVTVGAALCYSLTTQTETPRRIGRLITCAPGTLWFFCSACEICLNSYNSARWQVRRRRRRCWFPFLCGFQTTLACQRCHIKTLREPSLSQRFDGWKDRWADRWLHR